MLLVEPSVTALAGFEIQSMLREMNESELKLEHESVSYIRKHEQELIERFARVGEFEPDDKAVSLFMAGSPGAGKTETSKRLTEKFTIKPVRIDTDEIRNILPGYAGANAFVFQKAATLGVNILLDYVLHHSLNFIMDGTFAYYFALRNVERSIVKGRKVEVYFIYQDLLVAWDFTKKREEIEHRRVSKGIFIKSFFDAKENVNNVKRQFGEKVELNLIIQNLNTEVREFHLNINDIDQYLPTKYTENNLRDILI